MYAWLCWVDAFSESLAFGAVRRDQACRIHSHIRRYGLQQVRAGYDMAVKDLSWSGVSILQSPRDPVMTHGQMHPGNDASDYQFARRTTKIVGLHSGSH